ncbi:MAG: DUF1176 domain-containing protein [Pseudomonadota bacterium]
MKKSLFVWSALALAMVSPVAADDFEAFEWRGSCDDEGYCVARAAGRAPTGETMQLKLERPKAPNASLFATVRLDPAEPLSVGTPVTITVLETGYTESSVTQRVYTGNEMTFAGPVDRPLALGLREGTTARVDVEWPSQSRIVSYTVPLTGVTSVLADFDRLQGRAERGDAAVLVGGLPFPGQVREEVKAEPKASPTNEPTVSPLPEPSLQPLDEPLFPPVRFADLVYAQADVPDEVLMTGYRVFECDFPYVLEGYGAQVYGVTEFLELWIVPCNSADVNVDYYISFHSAGEAEYYDFLDAPFSDNRYSLVTNPRWANETRQLTTWTLYGPDGDCGNYATYEYVTEDDAFDLIRYQEKPNCDGLRSSQEDYPLVWSAY